MIDLADPFVACVRAYGNDTNPSATVILHVDRFGTDASGSRLCSHRTNAQAMSF